MKTIWVVEQHTTPASIAMELMGDFAVRRIASLGTLLRIKALDKTNLPDMIVVTETGEGLELLQKVQIEYSTSALFATADLNYSGSILRKLNHPFCPIEFVRMVRQSASTEPKENIKLLYGDLELDVLAQKVSVKSSEETISLTRKETRVLKTFFERPGACIDRESILQQVWDGVRVADRSIDAQICRLRKLFANHGITITSVYGQGYVLG